MTEDYWLTCTSPNPMLEYLRGKASDRKLILFACYCCRRLWHLLDDPAKRALEAWQRQAAGFNGKAVTAAPGLAYYSRLRELDRYSAEYSARSAVGRIGGAAWAGAWIVVGEACEALGREHPPRAHEESQKQASLVREMFGNPFRPSIVDGSWLTPMVNQLADHVYRNEDFDGLLVLSDAFEEAGCANVQILTHLRQPGPHCRGCWALDLVLCK